MDDSGERQPDWQAGLAAVDMTLAEPIWLSGWSDRSQPSSRVSHSIFAKALAVRHANGPISLLVSSDLMAYSAILVQELVTSVSQEFALPRERLVLCATHNHSAPVTANVLPLYYDMNAEQLAVVDRYSQTLPPLFIKAIGEAIDSLSPAKLEFGQNIAGFAMMAPGFF